MVAAAAAAAAVASASVRLEDMRRYVKREGGRQGDREGRIWIANPCLVMTHT
jgi:hypothetical protein